IAAGGGLVAIANAPVTNTDKKVTGEIVLAVPVELAPVKKRVAEQTTQATIIGLAAPVGLVAGRGGGPQLTVPIETETHAAISLQASVAEPPGAPRAGKNNLVRFGGFACMALAGIFLAVFVASALRRG